VTLLIVFTVWLVAGVADRASRYAGGWVWFSFVQLVMGVAALFGLFVLAVACAARWWTLDAKSIKDGRPIDRWRFPVPNAIYGNPEDGVSGQTALIMINPVDAGPYLPGAGVRRRAYRWSALRNSCDGLKYVFAWKGGPYTKVGAFKLGWHEESGIKVPVL
jgi:hypothetical protein